MQIKIDKQTYTVQEGETIIETARRNGIDIPSLCYAKGAKHQASCMVCAVKNTANGQIIPSCSTRPTEGMELESMSEELKLLRTLSLELLLSDHRADCEAPCSTVCPVGLDVGRVMELYDNQQHEQARAVIAAAFQLPTIACDTCEKKPCEKVCRRGTIDKAVEISQIIHDLVDGNVAPQSADAYHYDKSRFQSKVGQFTADEKARIKLTVDGASRCLHCKCSGQQGCQLRQLATAHGIRRSRYGSSSALPVLERQHIKGDMWFEPSKCIRCGLCVLNSDNGFTFRDRGFGMQVVIPEENKNNASVKLAELCPTGAIYLRGKGKGERGKVKSKT
ncbi:MAG: 2Fe-2S iron-sulfur cluster-binding protein [Mangrovibacterium sp.]